MKGGWEEHPLGVLRHSQVLSQAQLLVLTAHTELVLGLSGQSQHLFPSSRNSSLSQDSLRAWSGSGPPRRAKGQAAFLHLDASREAVDVRGKGR